MKSSKFILGILTLSVLFMLPQGSAAAQSWQKGEPTSPDYQNIPEYKPFKPISDYIVTCTYNAENYRKYTLSEYMQVKQMDVNVAFIKYCCNVGRNCRDGSVSDQDGNTVTLSAAENNALPALRFFAEEMGLAVDVAWRQNAINRNCDNTSRSELMHAIANNNLLMVRFLLGKETEETFRSSDGEKLPPNTIMYSNPRRTAPHPNKKFHFKYDARDFARWQEGKVRPDIIKLVEEVWDEAGEYEVGDRYSLSCAYYVDMASNNIINSILNPGQQIRAALKNTNLANFKDKFKLDVISDYKMLREYAIAKQGDKSQG